MLRSLPNHRPQQLENKIARDLSRGLLGLERVVAEHSTQGVHGRLIDLIDCAPQLATAVEVTAGNSLFHVVVENDDVALRWGGGAEKETQVRCVGWLNWGDLEMSRVLCIVTCMPLPLPTPNLSPLSSPPCHLLCRCSHLLSRS